MWCEMQITGHMLISSIQLNFINIVFLIIEIFTKQLYRIRMQTQFQIPNEQARADGGKEKLPKATLQRTRPKNKPILFWMTQDGEIINQRCSTVVMSYNATICHWSVQHDLSTTETSFICHIGSAGNPEENRGVYQWVQQSPIATYIPH